MDWILSQIHQHALLILFALFSIGVSAMPTPRADGSQFYSWLYKFAHLVALNWARLLAGTRFAFLLPGAGDTIPQQIEQANAKDARETAKP